MNKPPAKPNRTPRGDAEAEARARREAEALRANLKRRKGQNRHRESPPSDDKSAGGRNRA